MCIRFRHRPRLKAMYLQPGPREGGGGGYVLLLYVIMFRHTNTHALRARTHEKVFT